MADRKGRASAAKLESRRAEAAGCRDCPLWANATQTVFGEGNARARLMIVGEQPGDRATTYVTNAVKHFKWEPRGKRRLHKTPAQRELDAWAAARSSTRRGCPT